MKFYLCWQEVSKYRLETLLPHLKDTWFNFIVRKFAQEDLLILLQLIL